MWHGKSFQQQLCIDTRSSTDNTLHGSAGQWKKVAYDFRLKKAPEASNGDLTYYVFSLEDAVAHLSVTDPSRILTIEKQKKFKSIKMDMLENFWSWKIS